MIIDLKPGDVVTNKKITRLFKCSPQGGMRKSNQTKSLVLVSNHLKSLYDDRWVDGIFHYTGMGTQGDQSLTFMQNRTLAESKNVDLSIYLFEVFEEQKYTYIGQVILDGKPYQESQLDSNGQERNVWIFPLKLIHDKIIPIDSRVYTKIEQKRQKQVKRLSMEELKIRAFKTQRSIGKRPLVTTHYNRNAIVSEYAQRVANGYCQLCNAKAPFLNAQGKPYLETHHVIWLSKGGSDTIDNTVALCPNCHRKMHILNLPTDVSYLLKKCKDIMK